MKIVLVGSGNVAMHLGPALQKAGHHIIQLAGRTEKNTRLLADKLSCDFTVDPLKIKKNADVFLIALQDQAIKEYLKYIPSGTGLVLHTSGSVDSGIFSGSFENYGVLYPVQSFSMKRRLNFSRIPLCLEANNDKAKRKLQSLAKSLSSNLTWVNYEQRQTIHLAAVFANNFSNHLFTLAEDLLAGKKLSLDILRPLIEETAAKVQKESPRIMQTGPARRGDSSTIAAHLMLLKAKPGEAKIYEALTKSILDHDGPRL